MKSAGALIADVAQSAERVLGKDEVTGSNPVVGSTAEQKAHLGEGRDTSSTSRGVQAAGEHRVKGGRSLPGKGSRRQLETLQVRR